MLWVINIRECQKEISLMDTLSVFCGQGQTENPFTKVLFQTSTILQTYSKTLVFMLVESRKNWMDRFVGLGYYLKLNRNGNWGSSYNYGVAKYGRHSRRFICKEISSSPCFLALFRVASVWKLLPLPRRLCFCHVIVCLLATLLQKLTGLYEIFREGQKWHMDQLIRFWQWSGFFFNFEYTTE